MRLALACVALLLATALPIDAQDAAEPSPPLVQIVEVMSDPDTTAGQREFIELWNAGDAAVPLAGWKLRDQATASGTTNTYTFPPWTLAPNGRVVVWGGGASDPRGPAWSNPTVWNNAGDGVSLLGADGTLVAWMGYGNALPPAGHESDPVPAPPAKGQSLEWDAQTAAWRQAAPSPGSAPGAVGGTMAIDVTNVAPIAAFDNLPSSARPGQAMTLSLRLDDGNGAADIASWALTSGAGTIASGTTGGLRTVQVNAPSTEGPWRLSLQAYDHAGATALANATLAVRASDLVVLTPTAPLGFGSAGPGATDLTASQPVIIRNEGSQPLTPLLDISPFTHDSGAAFPAEGHVWLALGDDTWVPYTHALHVLPGLAPGASVEVTFQLRGIPLGLAAGSYGSSFAVVAQ